MSDFNVAVGKNILKLSFLTVAAVASTMGLRTEFAVILNDVAVATWVSLVWFFVVIFVLAYYKAKQDVEINVYREYERNLHRLGRPQINQEKLNYSLKVGDPVFLSEVPVMRPKQEEKQNV